LLQLPEDVQRHLRRKEPVPKLEDIVKLSQGGDAYHWVCTKMLKAVVGNSVWNKRFYRELLSEFSTDSDESFVVLTLENNYQRWVDEAAYRTENPNDDDKEDDETWKENLAPAKYTNSGVSSSNGRATNKRCGGWSKAGYLRFNELHGLVKEDRKRRANFELALKDQFEAEHAMEEKDDDSDEGEEIMPANDMTGVRQPMEATEPE
jgi:hypothetical protein